jgi:predicted RNA-binding protein with EMAP domain
MSEYTYKSWEEMSEQEQLQCTFWDAYKDAHGFRPRHIDTTTLTVEELKSDIARLASIIQDNERVRIEDEAAAVVRFETRVASIIQLGAKDREMAMRWIHEAEGSDGDDEYLCFLVGVPYGYIKTAVAA